MHRRSPSSSGPFRRPRVRRAGSRPAYPGFGGFGNSPKKKPAARSLLAFLSERSSVETLINASRGYDVPVYEKFRDFAIWAQEGPPPGTLFNYPPRGDVTLSITGAPAPPKIANQMYAQGTITKLIARYTQRGETIDQAIAWAEQEIEGFRRT